MVVGDVNILNFPPAGSVQTIGRIKDIEITEYLVASITPVSYTVWVNQRIYLQEQLQVYIGATFRLDLKEMLSHVFEFGPPLFDNPDPQLSHNIKEIDIRITCDGSSADFNFFILNNKLDYIDPDTFYSRNFLTLYPLRKKVFTNDIEVLTAYVDAPPVAVYCRASNGVQSHTIEYVSLNGGLFNMVLRFDQLLPRFTIRNITSVYFFIGEYDDPDQYGQTFIFSPGKAPQTPVFYFENSAGGFDMVRVRGEVKDKNKYKTDTAQRRDKLIGLHVNDPQAVSVNSGYLSTEQERLLFKSFLTSLHKYIYEYGELLEVLVTESSSDAVRRELAVFTFDYKLTVIRQEVSPRFKSQLAKRSEIERFGFDNESVMPSPNDVATLRFMLNGEPKVLPSHSYYEVQVSTRLRTVFSGLSVENLNDSIVIAFNTGSAITQSSATQGLVTAKDILTGQEAYAMIAIPAINMTGTNIPAEGISVVNGDLTFNVRFLNSFGFHAFRQLSDYTALVDDNIKNYFNIRPEELTLSGFSMTSNPAGGPPAITIGYITIVDHANGDNEFKIKVTIHPYD